MARENDFELSDYVNPDGSLKFGPKAVDLYCPHGEPSAHHCQRCQELLNGAEPTPQEELEMEMGGGELIEDGADDRDSEWTFTPKGELSEDEYQRIFGMPEHPSDTWEEHRGER